MSRFLEALHSGQVLLMDGAMGTELRRVGLPDNACGEYWNLTHPDRVLAIQRRYVEAGADCLITNTFGGSRIMLARHGHADEDDLLPEGPLDEAHARTWIVAMS